MDQWKDRGEYAFSRNGRAYTESERRELFLRKGQCPKCGIQTHKVSLRIKRVACNNDDVWQGICIKCRPSAVPKDVLSAWTAKRAASGNNTTSSVQLNSKADPSKSLAPRNEGNTAHAASATSTAVSPMRYLQPRPYSTSAAYSSPGMTSPERARTGEHFQQSWGLGRPESSSMERSPHSRSPFATFDEIENDATRSKGRTLTNWMSTVVGCIGETDQVILALLGIPPLDAEVVQEACRVGALERFLVKLRLVVAASNTNRSLWVSLSTALQSMVLSGSKEVARQISDQGYHVLFLDRLVECNDVVEVQHLLLSIVVFVTYEPAAFIQANGIHTVLKVLPAFHTQPIVLELASRCIYCLLSDAQQRIVEKALSLLNREVAAFFEGLFTIATSSSSTSCFTWGARAVLAIYAVGDSERKSLVLDEFKCVEEARLLCLSSVSPNDQFMVQTVWIIFDALIDQHSPVTLVQKASEVFLSLGNTTSMHASLGSCANVLISCLACGDEDSRQNVRMSANSLMFPFLSASFDCHCHLAASCMWSLWSLSEFTLLDKRLIPSLVQYMADMSSRNGFGSGGESHDTTVLWFSFYGIISNVFVSQSIELCKTSVILPICATSDTVVAGASLMQVEAFALSVVYSHYPESFLEQHASSIVESYVDFFVTADEQNRLLGIEAFAYIATGNAALRSPPQLLQLFHALSRAFKAAKDPLFVGKGLDLVLFLLSKCESFGEFRGLLEGIGDVVLSSSAINMSPTSARIIQFVFESSSTPPVPQSFEHFFSSTMTKWQSQDDETRDALWLALWALLSTNLERHCMSTRLFMLVVDLLRDCLQQKLATDKVLSVNASMIRSATGALSCASRRLTQPVSFKDADTVVSMIYYVMGNEREETKSLEPVLESVINLLELSKGPLIECGVIVAIIDAMDEFEASLSVQLRGSTALASLASSKTLQVILSILQTDGIDALVGAISSFPSNQDIQREVCRAFSYLSVDEESRMVLRSQGGVFLLTQAMRLCPDCCLVQEYASETLIAIASDAPTSLSDPAVIDLALTALTRHKYNSALQEHMVSLICFAASACSSCEARVIQLRGEDVILRTARRFLDDAAIVERCFSALGVLLCKLSSRCEDDTIRTIITGMLAHMEDDLVPRHACKCLSILAGANKNNVSSVRVLGGERAIILVLRTHFRSKETSAAALQTYFNLGESEFHEEDVDVIASAVWRFREDPDFLSVGCQILSNAVPKFVVRDSRRPRVEAVLNCAKPRFAESYVKNAELGFMRDRER